MIKLSTEQFNIVSDLFEQPTSTIILSCIQGYLGEIWVDDSSNPQIALMYAGKTFYVASRKCDTLIIPWIQMLIEQRKIEHIEIIPQNQESNRILENFMDDRKEFYLKKTCRHLMILENMQEKLAYWRTCVGDIWNEVELCEVDEHLFELVRKDKYLSNFICNFKTYQEFKNLGVGYFILKDKEIIGGASSFTRYDKGIEVQIAITPEFRRRGLAKACAAKLLMTCYREGLYPNWDAANPNSEMLAKSLGYKLLRENSVYRFSH